MQTSPRLHAISIQWFSHNSQIVDRRLDGIVLSKLNLVTKQTVAFWLLHYAQLHQMGQL